MGEKTFAAVVTSTRAPRTFGVGSRRARHTAHARRRRDGVVVVVVPLARAGLSSSFRSPRRCWRLLQRVSPRSRSRRSNDDGVVLVVDRRGRRAAVVRGQSLAALPSAGDDQPRGGAPAGAPLGRPRGRDDAKRRGASKRRRARSRRGPSELRRAARAAGDPRDVRVVPHGRVRRRTSASSSVVVVVVVVVVVARDRGVARHHERRLARAGPRVRRADVPGRRRRDGDTDVLSRRGGVSRPRTRGDRRPGDGRGVRRRRRGVRRGRVGAAARRRRAATEGARRDHRHTLCHVTVSLSYYRYLCAIAPRHRAR